MSVSEEVTATIKKTILDDTTRVGKIVFGGLIDTAQVNKLPESVFVKQFLPLFTGKVENPPENWTLHWVGIAGTPMNEVSIIDDRTKEELFRVPALLQSTGLFLSKEEGDLGDILSRYNQITQNLPTSGLGFLLSALNHKNKEYLEAFDNSVSVEKWLSIFKRYGILPENHTEEKNGSELDTTDYFDF